VEGNLLIGKGWSIVPCLLLSGCVCGPPRVATDCAGGRVHHDCPCCAGAVSEYGVSADRIALSDELAAQGRRLESERQFDSAARFYRLAVKMSPGNASALNALGILSARQGKLSDARRALSRAVAVDPATPVYRNNLATVLVDQQRYDDALRQLVAAGGSQIGRHNLLHMLSVDFAHAGESRSLIETLMSQQVDDAVYFDPVDGEDGEDLTPPDDEQLPPLAPTADEDASPSADLSNVDSAAPTEEDTSPPAIEVPEADETVPRNTIPEPPKAANPLRHAPQNELPAEPAANTGSTLRLIPAR